MTASVVAVVAAALREHTMQSTTTGDCKCGENNSGYPEYLAESFHRLHVAEVVVEAQREAATITTVEQLDALPDDSAVLVDDTPARKHLGDWYFANDDGDGYGSRSLALYLPALLLWHPEWAVPQEGDG